MLFRKLWLSLCAGALLAVHPLQAEEPTQLREVRVAYIGILPSETTEHAVYPTFDFLKSQLGHKYRFKLFDISNHDFLEEINVLKPHLLFAPSEIYLQLAAIPQLNAHDIAALKSVFSSKTSASVGSVFITRADRNDINTIADMKGKRVAAANNENLSEWWAALGELKERGYAPNRFFGSERFTRERHLGAVEEVLAGSSDVGILPTYLLEAYEGVGFVAPGSLKVIEPYDNAKDESPFYCRRSTRALYPGIVISSLANAPDDIVKDVVRTLFTMPAFQGNEWAAGYDYTEVLRLMRDLKFGMYENLRDYSLGALLQRYKTELLILLTILLFLIGNELRVHHLVNKRTAELKGALEAKNAAEQEAVLGRKRLSHIERSGVISQMSNIIAHELKQPLGALLNYAAVLKLRLNDKMAEDPLTKTVVENMDAETRRISRIVDSVRKFAKKEQPAHIEYDLVRIVEKAIRTFHQQEEAKTAVPFRTDAATAPVLADPLSLELLILNLIRNAAAASKESGRPKLGVSLEPVGKRWKVTVWNNGLVLSDEQFTRLEHAAESTKPEGLGLGLSIVREIADMHSASLHFERLAKGGVRAELMIDRLATKDPEKKNQ